MHSLQAFENGDFVACSTLLIPRILDTLFSLQTSDKRKSTSFVEFCRLSDFVVALIEVFLNQPQIIQGDL
jgi:hypothetical protein